MTSPENPAALPPKSQPVRRRPAPLRTATADSRFGYAAQRLAAGKEAKLGSLIHDFQVRERRRSGEDVSKRYAIVVDSRVDIDTIGRAIRLACIRRVASCIPRRNPFSIRSDRRSRRAKARCTADTGPDRSVQLRAYLATSRHMRDGRDLPALAGPCRCGIRRARPAKRPDARPAMSAGKSAGAISNAVRRKNNRYAQLKPDFESGK